MHQQQIEKSIGVVKAYTSRVGGRSVTRRRLKSKCTQLIFENGHEYGTTTEHPRRVGWIDLVNMRYATILNHYDRLIVTLIDVLQGINTLKLCVAYNYKGERPRNDRTNPNSCRMLDRNILKCQMSQLSTIEEWDAMVAEGYDALPQNEGLHC